jgi:predicted outer membrane repeat protein
LSATTILDGNQEWNLLAIHASDVDLTVSNLTFSNGNAGYGSAILLFDNGHRSSLTIEDSVFSSNNNEGAGAVHVEQGSAYVYDSTFSFNTGSRGAAVNVHKGMAFIESSQFYANTATGKAGAITATGKHSIVQVGLSYFEDNFAEEQGGAINVKDATLGIYFSTFVGNETNGSGGAIAQQGYDAVASNIYGSTFISNEAAVDGGAVWLRDADHRYDVRDSNFRNNHADGRGGGIYIDDQGRRATERDIAVVTNKFVGNTADLGGGMYYSLNDTGKSSTGAVPSIVLGNTFQRNSAQSGGGLAFATNYDGVTFGRVLRELNRKLVSNSFAGNRTRDKFSAKIYVLN